MTYCVDSDLEKFRPSIMELGVGDWTQERSEAKRIIDRALDVGWYREEAEHMGVDWRDYPFASGYLLNSNDQLKTLACYKTLELAYMHLMKDSAEPDAFQVQMNIFKDLYLEELRQVLSAGLDYDWDGSGALTGWEKKRPSRRRLLRC